jgi:hypothetical protein
MCQAESTERQPTGDIDGFDLGWGEMHGSHAK